MENREKLVEGIEKEIEGANRCLDYGRGDDFRRSARRLVGLLKGLGRNLHGPSWEPGIKGREITFIDPRIIPETFFDEDTDGKRLSYVIGTYSPGSKEYGWMISYCKVWNDLACKAEEMFGEDGLDDEEGEWWKYTKKQPPWEK